MIWKEVLAIKIDDFNMSMKAKEKNHWIFYFFTAKIYCFRQRRCVWYDRELWEWIWWKMIFYAYIPRVHQGCRHRNNMLFFQKINFVCGVTIASHHYIEMLFNVTSLHPPFQAVVSMWIVRKISFAYQQRNFIKRKYKQRLGSSEKYLRFVTKAPPRLFYLSNSSNHSNSPLQTKM